MKMICRYVILSFPLSLQASIYLEIYELESFLGFIECFFFYISTVSLIYNL